MRLAAFFIAFIAAWLLALPAGAAPTDEMFARLKAAATEQEAADVAEDIWATWLESGSATADLLMSRANEAIEAGDLALARELLDRAIAVRPRFAEAWHRRAGLFVREENFPEALRDLSEALTLEPRHFGAWVGMALIMENLGRDKAALESYREALAIYPLMPEARNGEARLKKKTEGTDL